MLSISKLLKKTGHQIYTNITTILSVSLFWSLFLVPAIFILSRVSAVIFMMFTFIPATTAVYAVMHQVMNTHRSKMSDVFRYFVHYYKRAFLIGLSFSVAVLIPVSQWWFYLQGDHHFGMLVFTMFQTYFCLTFLSTQVYTIPYLVMEDGKAFQSMNRSVKKFMSQTWYTMGLFVQIISVTLLLCVSIVGFFLLYIGMLAVFVLNATENVSIENRDKVSHKEEPQS